MPKGQRGQRFARPARSQERRRSARPTAGDRTGEPPGKDKRARSDRPGRPSPAKPASRDSRHRPREPDFDELPRQRGRRRPDARADASDAVKQASGAPAGDMRIAKAMARAGLCSRRDAERWIAEGRVKVNGETLASPACDVGPKDRILVDGKPLPDSGDVRLWRYHKPKGLVTTHRDPQGRPTVFDKMPPELPRVVSIGRLDVNSEGLLLLTNSGELARHMELPATGWLRRYRVRAWGKITQADLDALKAGRDVEGVHYGPMEATLDRQQGDNVWITVGLREGKNREVRKVLGSLGLQVNRLIRVSFGPFQLLDLMPGAVEPVRRRVLADQLGDTLARRFGLTAEADERRELEAARGRRRRQAAPERIENEP